jgi:DNA-binding CsgD family transcriptional regulator
MEMLSASGLRKVLQVTANAFEFRELSEFRAGAIGLVRELVPCDSVSYNEVRPGEGAIVVADPAGALTPESVEIFAAFAAENPLIAHYTRTGDGRPLRFSDLISPRQLHRLSLYDQLYRQIGVEHQIAFVLPSPPGEVVGIALNRACRDFTAQEAAMLDLLRTPLHACYQRLAERERLTAMLAAYEGHESIATRAPELGLSERQLEVLGHVIGGASNVEVGISLGISRRTVEKHLQHIYARLEVTSRTQAIERSRTRTDS